jgi:anthranilate 1,2-dioxygenase small subunit
MDCERMTEAELQFRVERLLAQYIECIDDDRLEDWPDLFVADCNYRIIPRENADRGLPLTLICCEGRGMLVDRVVSLRQANIYARHYYRHVLSNVHVKSVDSGAVIVQSNYVVFQTRRNGATDVYSAGKYMDKIVVSDSALLFKEKIVTVDTYRVDSLMATPI